MVNEIKYDFSYLNEAIADVKALKGELPFKKGVSYKWNCLYTDKSKGDVLDTLAEIVTLTEERSRQIGELLDNVLMVLQTAKDQMQHKDEKISKEYKG
ncbi:MAG: hypothetical protein E7530_03795 [Ruminococcaceae bacterium]|nr:hypothetical protein [Oscillospiraceae bacterium]